MRLVNLLPGVSETLYALGLGEQLVARADACVWPHAATSLPVVARYLDAEATVPAGWLLAASELLPAHEHRTRLVLDQEALRIVQPDVILTEETCPVCAAAYTPLAGDPSGKTNGEKPGVSSDAAAASPTGEVSSQVSEATTVLRGVTLTLDGQAVRVLSVTPRHLDEAVDVILPLAGALGYADRGVTLHKTRFARLLALRMHVARSVVRAAARQPRTTLMLRHRGGTTPPPWITEMLDAAGGADVRVLPWPEPPIAPSPARFSVRSLNAPPSAAPPAASPDELFLIGNAGQSPDALRDAFLAQNANLPPHTWAVDADYVFSYPGPHLIEGVECLLRLILPAALGANGTPPPPDQALPVHP